MDLNIFKEQTQQSILSEVETIADMTRVIAGSKPQTWEGIQAAVRSNKIRLSVAIADQLVAKWNNVNRDWDVQGFDECCPADATKTHSLDILAHDCLGTFVFEPAQMIYGVRAEDWPNGLPAGTYNIGYATSASETTYRKFTTTQVVPVGGGIQFSNADFAAATVSTIAADRYTTIESGITTEAATDATDGTALGVTSAATAAWKQGDAINFYDRVRYGANRWRYSFMRQWLNSDEEVMTWTPGTIWSRRPSTLPAGFLYNLDPALKAVLGSVRVRYAIPNCDGGGYEDLEDLVTLQTMLDMGFGNNGNVVEGPVDAEGTVKRSTAYSLWVGKSNSDRIKYNGTSASYWWVSSTYPSDARYERFVYNSGALDNGSGYNAFGVVPSLHII